MTENKYFTRKINEGTVKRTHFCSFDNSIKLEMIVTNSKKVIDYIVKTRSQSAENKEEEAKRAEFLAKQNFMNDLSKLRINGLPIIFEELGNCFDSEEILEVQAFVNGADMTIFGGTEKAEIPNG